MVTKIIPKSKNGAQSDPKRSKKTTKVTPSGPEGRPRRPQVSQKSVQEGPKSIYLCFMSFPSDPSHLAECTAEPNNLSVREVNRTKHHKTYLLHLSSAHFCIILLLRSRRLAVYPTRTCVPEARCGFKARARIPPGQGLKNV